MYYSSFIPRMVWYGTELHQSAWFPHLTFCLLISCTVLQQHQATHEVSEPNALLRSSKCMEYGLSEQQHRASPTHTIVDLHNKHWELHTVNLSPKADRKGGRGKSQKYDQINLWGIHVLHTAGQHSNQDVFTKQLVCFTHFISIRMVA